jgi:histidinol-phosphatase (PHP family)
MRIDYHTHTRLSDGTGKPVDYARAARERGIAEIGLSDHAPITGRAVSWAMRPADLAEYVRLVRDAQRAVPKVSVKLGLEVDYLPGCDAWVRVLAAMYPWDYFLGSVHFLGEFPVDRAAADWQHEDLAARWREYFALWADAARSGLFDALAHPDLPKKFGFRPAGDLTPLHEEALRVVAAAGVAIEVSTGGLRQPCHEIYPAPEFLRLACRLGIPVTLGSDAHRPEDVGRDFDQAVALLRSCGYSQVSQFTARQRTLVPLAAVPSAGS